MSSATAPTSALEHLAERIHAGEVVFFVGAGFSIDSEGLSAELIIKRLLVRLDALDRLQASPHGDALRGLASVFGVADTLAGINASIAATKSAGNVPHRLDSHLSRLAFRYYELNSWLCQAFAERFVRAVPATYADFTAALQKAEADTLVASGWANDPWSRDRLAFTPFPESWWQKSRPVPLPGDPPGPILPCSPQEAARLGKLVFIQSTGLFSESIMAGEAYDPRKNPACSHAFARTYGDRLRPRHHVIARLAREGLCSTLVTTNFDLLLEGAFRLAGFHSAQARATPPIPTSWPRFDVIASPEAFFTRGKAFRTATVVKLHGCAGQLRKTPSDLDALVDYLPQLVYTYREIQNWRDDSWAAEFLRTLLRTRAFVFSGYSTADPVLHDTFRGVYEEMARKLGRESSPRTESKDAPAYFLAYSGDDQAKEFHANEVLASASRAVGARPDTHDRDHPHYLRFAPGWIDAPGRLKLDETMLWLQHRVLRRQQTEAIRHELPSVAATLLGRRPAADFTLLQDRFNALVGSENEIVHAAFLSTPRTRLPDSDAAARRRIVTARRQLEATTAWSHGFHPALRREWAHAAAFVRRPGSFREFAELQHPLWYYPANERPDWTAWSAVVELALRELARLACACGDGPDATPRPGSNPAPDDTEIDAPIVATLAAKPTVLIKRHSAASAPRIALTLQIRDHSRPAGRRPTCPGHPARHAVWNIPEEHVPWRKGELAELPAPASAQNPGTGNPAKPRGAPPSKLRLPVPRRIGPVQWCDLPPASVLWDLALGRRPTVAVAVHSAGDTPASENHAHPRRVHVPVPIPDLLDAFLSAA